MNSENEDIAGVVVPGFTVRRRIGEGGFAAVFEAIQDDVGATVALKVLATGVGTAQSQRRLEREYRSMGRLRDLRGIVPVYGTTATAEGLPVIVMAYMAGGSLLDRLRANGPLSVEEVLHITDVLCEALQAAHDAGIYHRDIKPENILLDRYGQPALSDFGIASVEGVQDASQTAASLSPPHAPPERFTGSGTVEPVPADIYSLASTLHQLLTGRAPFGSTSDGGIAALIMRITGDAPPPIDRGDVPPALIDTILAGLAKNPADRPASAAHFARRARDLTPVAEPEPTDVTVPMPYASDTVPRPALAADAETRVVASAPALPGDHTPAVPETPATPEQPAATASAPDTAGEPATARSSKRSFLLALVAVILIGLSGGIVSRLLSNSSTSADNQPRIPEYPRCTEIACWRGAEVAAVNANEFWRDVSCPEPNFCLAVGESSIDPRTLQWDGKTWAVVLTPANQVPQASGVNAVAEVLHAVTCTNRTNCWAVGEAGPESLIMRWDGSSWTVVPTPPRTSKLFGILRDVTCTDPANCWAVGLGRLILRWDGREWSTARDADPCSDEAAFCPQAVTFASVACASATQCWATGYRDEGGGTTTPRNASWQGGEWKDDSVDFRRANIVNVTCPGPRDCWAVGTGGRVFRWNGTAWRAGAISPRTREETVTGEIACAAANSCWVPVSRPDGNAGLLRHWNGRTWATLAGDPSAISCASPTACWGLRGFSSRWVRYSPINTTTTTTVTPTN